MSERPIEPRLRELADELRWPATPDLSERVIARIAADAPAGAAVPAARRRRPPRRSPLTLGPRRSRVLAVIVALLVAGAVVEPVRSAVLDVLGIAGRAKIIRVPGPPDTSRPRMDRGATTTLEKAQARLAFTITLPRLLGTPREVRYSDAIAGGAVTLVYPDAALLEFQGGPDPVLQKLVGASGEAQQVTVSGEQGFFITGDREIALLDRDGHVVQSSRSLARSDALIWQRDGIAYRLEANAGLRRALVIARSVR